MTETEACVEDPDLLFPLLEGMTGMAAEDVDDILSSLTGRDGFPPDSVLDVGCGIGNYVIPMAERGVETHGLDVTPEFVERARERAAEAGVEDRTEFFDPDMRDLDGLPGTYDAAVCITAFGYFDDEANEALVAAVHDRLEPGGTALFNVANKEMWLITRKHDANSVIRVGDGYTYARRRRYDPLDSRLSTTTRVIRDGTSVGQYEYDRRLYTPVELPAVRPRRVRRGGDPRRLRRRGADGSRRRRRGGRTQAVGAVGGRRRRGGRPPGAGVVACERSAGTRGNIFPRQWRGMVRKEDPDGDAIIKDGGDVSVGSAEDVIVEDAGAVTVENGEDVFFEEGRTGEATIVRAQDVVLRGGRVDGELVVEGAEDVIIEAGSVDTLVVDGAEDVVIDEDASVDRVDVKNAEDVRNKDSGFF
ncbi:hypothetical protein BRD00_06690 [Halobacteriales archaeon QS_8_69_26]|nr:MAG: hypothetical protein BRD00_06690 [Halobacteriales archaeon QS_8_69_26]